MNLASDAKVSAKLRKPHVTEVVKMFGDIEFPLLPAYERMNGTIEGIKESRDLDGRAIRDSDDHGGEGGGSEPGEDDDPGDDDDDHGSGKKKIIGEDLRSLHRGGEGPRDDGKSVYDLSSSDGEGGRDEMHPDDRGEASSASRDPVLKELLRSGLAMEPLSHVREGKKSDGIIYINDEGKPCKIDKRGVPYKVGPDGRRDLTSSRQKGKYSPEEWKTMTGREKEIAIEVEKYEAEEKTKKKGTSGISEPASDEKDDDEEVDDDIATPSIVLAEQQLDDVEAQFAELWEHSKINRVGLMPNPIQRFTSSPDTTIPPTIRVGGD